MNVCIGQIIGAHGIRGIVKFKPAVENEALLTDFKHVKTQDNNVLSIKVVAWQKGYALVKIQGVEDRTNAEKFTGVSFFVDADVFPQLEQGEFYCRDLIGLEVFEKEQLFGHILSVENFGAGDIIVINTIDGKQELIAFTEENFPVVDMENKKVILKHPNIAGTKYEG